MDQFQQINQEYDDNQYSLYPTKQSPYQFQGNSYSDCDQFDDNSSTGISNHIPNQNMPLHKQVSVQEYDYQQQYCGNHQQMTPQINMEYRQYNQINNSNFVQQQFYQEQSECEQSSNSDIDESQEEDEEEFKFEIKQYNDMKFLLEKSRKIKKKRYVKDQQFAQSRKKQRQLYEVIYYVIYWIYYQENSQINDDTRPFSKDFSMQLMEQEYFQMQMQLEKQIYNQVLPNNKFDRRKENNIYADQAAVPVQIKKQTLDDYQTTLKKCIIIGFDFKKALNLKLGMGQVRKQLKEYQEQKGIKSINPKKISKEILKTNLTKILKQIK